MRVVLNALQAGNRSGTGRYATQLARWLPVSGDVEVVVVWPRGVPRPLVDGQPRDVLLVPGKRAPRRMLFDQAGIHYLRQRRHADLVHYPANIGTLARLGPNVVTIHDLSYIREPAWFRRERALYYRFAVERSARTASRIIADSHATAADLHELFNVPTDRIDVIPLGVESLFHPVPEDQRPAVTKRYGLPDTFFLYIGTLEPRKNLERLVAAFELAARDCDDHHLVLAGRDGWKTAALHQKIAASPVRHRIHTPGFIAYDDLPAVLSAAHAFVWPSLYEGFGLPPLEAMACGTPTLVSDVSSLPEVVGDAALLVNPYDIEALAHGMRRIANDGPFRAGLRARGRIRAGEFTWARTAERTLATYEAALS